ncbi:LCP family protein [Frankia sp. Ag45/Mut15]|uniref:LCP family protein n=1 Tax=Frankia umida TaxID=573489 RepID=A0ABT0JXJ2_9ACTN|nr:LCP family protein [Frankia umida]MCK9876266.1 LCP family protein [Frankia umida]
MTWPPHRPDRDGPPEPDRGDRPGRGAPDPRGGAPRDPGARDRAPRTPPGRDPRRVPPAENWPAGRQPQRRPPAAGPPTRRYPDARGDRDGRAGQRGWDGRVGDADRYPDSRQAGAIPPTRIDRPVVDRPGTREPEPAAEPAQRLDGVRRVVTVVAAAMAMVVLVLATAGWSVLRHYDGRVSHVALRFGSGADRPSAAGGGTQNILLVGSDSRAGTNGAFGQTDGQRSDTTILAHLDANGSTTLISFPRDLWVTIPAYTDARGTDHAAQRSKLNAAFSYGGPSLLVSTIETLTGIRVNHYVQIDFVGFQGMTDALGGVTVCIRELPTELKARGFDNLHDRFSGFSGQVGENRLDGAQALAFVRQRYGLPESDLDRIRRQQQFLGVIFKRISSSDTLLNPSRMINVVDAATAALTLDDGTSLADLRLLALRMQSIGSGGVVFATVPAVASTRAGQSVLLPDPATLATFLKPFGGSTSEQGTTGALSVVPGGSGAGGSGGAAVGTGSRTAVPVGWTRPLAASVVAADAPAAGAAPAGCTY